MLTRCRFSPYYNPLAMSQNATTPMAIKVQSFQSSGPMLSPILISLFYWQSIYFLGGNAIIGCILIKRWKVMSGKTLRGAYEHYPIKKAELKQILKLALINDNDDGSDHYIGLLSMLAQLNEKMKFYVEGDQLIRTPFGVNDIAEEAICDLNIKLDDYDFSDHSDPYAVCDAWKDTLNDIDSYIRLIFGI